MTYSSIILAQLKALSEDFSDPLAINSQIPFPMTAPMPSMEMAPKESTEEQAHYLGVIAAIKKNQDEFAKLIDQVSTLKYEAAAAPPDKAGVMKSELQAKLKLVDEKFEELEKLYIAYKELHSETKSDAETSLAGTEDIPLAVTEPASL